MGRFLAGTLADANRTHDWRIWADFVQVLITRAQQLYINDSLSIELEQTVDALGSTTTDLCFFI